MDGASQQFLGPFAVSFSFLLFLTFSLMTASPANPPSAELAGGMAMSASGDGLPMTGIFYYVCHHRRRIFFSEAFFYFHF